VVRTAAALALGGALATAAELPPADPVAALRAGKQAFEKNCRLCHGLERSLATRQDAEAWLLTVKRMVKYGAPLSAEKRILVARYLFAQSAFAARCGGCHEPAKALEGAKGPRDWQAIAGRMAGHVADLARRGKTPGAVALSPAALGEIAAFLQAVALEE
jgi:mono/diheme cytochrome c family protein